MTLKFHGSLQFFDMPDRAFNFAKIPSQEIGEDPNVKCTDSIQVVKF